MLHTLFLRGYVGTNYICQSSLETGAFFSSFTGNIYFLLLLLFALRWRFPPLSLPWDSCSITQWSCGAGRCRIRTRCASNEPPHLQTISLNIILYARILTEMSGFEPSILGLVAACLERLVTVVAAVTPLPRVDQTVPPRGNNVMQFPPVMLQFV